MKTKILAALFVAGGVLTLPAQVVFTGTGSYSQDFNTLVNSGSATWTDNSTLSAWYAQRTGNGTQIVANAGSSNIGNLYSYGTGTDADRALGSLGSGNAAAGSFAWGLQIQNNSGGVLSINSLSFTGEQWRNSTAAAQTVTFWYQVSSTAITSLTPGSNTGWTAFTALDFTSPVTLGSSPSALDGNLPANQAARSTSALGVTLAQGEYLMFRWSDPDHSGGDHGLAIDDFSVTVVPEPATATALLGGLGAMLWVIRRRRRMTA